MTSKKNPVFRQSLRKGLIITSFLFFPIFMNYLSPYVIIDGASQGIVNGSLVSFTLMFIGSLFLGRLWCGWVCPAGGLGEIAGMVNNQPVNRKKIDWIKWAVWFPWIGVIIWSLISMGGYHSIDLLLDTQNGISVAGSVDRPILIAYIIYYVVVFLFFLLAVFVGRRAGCHTICWMAPFMILGRRIRNTFGWPALRLKARAEACTSCLTCTTNCPMSLDVNAMVKAEKMENDECLLCGSCIDGCPSKAIRYSFSSGK
ncbi:MAG: 4Fe-4S binding protein [Anaerolineaceae bacterium]